MQTLVDHHRQFVDNTLMNRKPVKFMQDERDVMKLPGLRHHSHAGAALEICGWGVQG